MASSVPSSKRHAPMIAEMSVRPATLLLAALAFLDPNGTLRLAFGLDGQTNLDGETASGFGVLLVGLATDGTTAWHRLLTSEYANVIGGLATDTDGSVVLTGLVSGRSDLGEGAVDGKGTFLGKYGRSGEVLWTKTFFTEAYNNRGVDVEIDDGGDIHLLAQADAVDFGGGEMPTYPPGLYEGEVALARFDPCGRHLFSRSYGRATTSDVGRLALSPDGGLLIAGGTEPAADDEPMDFGGGSVAGPEGTLFVVKMAR
jgi:hypothetical protein